jgi:conjugative relaxase-like TrwC/TraI family protein
MLSMHAINNVNYYADLATEDYYTAGGEPSGMWVGLGARHLGLQGQVDTEDYRSVFRGYAPNGTALCENPGDNHRPGWDLTFSAPKSVSVLWARADEATRRAIQRGQFQAVQSALQFLEQHAAFTRRGKGGLIQERVLGLIAATFEHSTSRAQDPQLHTHCLIANAAPRIDGTWGTLESRHFFWWRKAAGAVYRSALANHLREQGFSIDEVEGEQHFEVSGISQAICAHFSKRAAAIEAALEAAGLDTSASKAGDTFKLTTREYKQAVDRQALFKQWHQQLDTLGLPASQIGAIRDPAPVVLSEPLPLTSLIAQLVAEQAVFRLQDVYTAVAVQAQFHHTTLAEIEASVQTLLEDEDLITLGKDEANNQLFTTQAMLDIEQALIAAADGLHQQSHYRLDEQTIQAAIDQQAAKQGFALSDEQAEAVFSVCQSGLDILQGAAGAGKSTSMQAVRLAHEAAGFKVRGAAVARKAAAQLEAETGIASTTVAKLLTELSSGKARLTGTAVIIDEAGQLASPDLLALTRAVQQAGGKLILVGEQQQLEAISHSGTLRYFSQRQGCARIETIRRQREGWAREAVMHLRAGQADKALALHQAHGQLHIMDNSERTRYQLIKHWQQYASRHPDKQSLILAQRWRDVKPLCDLVRQVYQARGLVGRENIITECSVGNQSLYFAFSSGERVRFTRNDYRRELTNGEEGTIEHIEQLKDDICFTVRTDSGRIVSFRQSDYCDEQGRLYLVQAYASTVYSSQGMTIDGDVFVYYSTGMDRAASYVAGSRHKDNCHWFVNAEELDALNGTKDKGLVDITQIEQGRLATLTRCMSTNREKLLASEYLAEQAQPQSTRQTSIEWGRAS